MLYLNYTVNISSFFRFGGFMKKLITFLFLSLLAHTFSITAMESYPELEVRETQQIIINKEELLKADTKHTMILYGYNDWSAIDYYQILNKSHLPDFTIVGHKYHARNNTHAIAIHFTPKYDISKKALEIKLNELIGVTGEYGDHIILDIGHDAYNKYQQLNW